MEIVGFCVNICASDTQHVGTFSFYYYLNLVITVLHTDFKRLLQLCNEARAKLKPKTSWVLLTVLGIKYYSLNISNKMFIENHKP